VCDSSSLFYYFLFFKKRKKKERKLFDITGTLGSHVVLWVSYLGGRGCGGYCTFVAYRYVV